MTHTVRRRIERASDAKRELRAAKAERGWRSSVFFWWINMKLVEVSMKEKLRVAMFGAAVIIGTKNRGTRD